MSANLQQSVRFHERIGDEDQQRADLYGVLATLFAAPPNADLLLSLRVQLQENGAPITPLERAWQSLCEAANVATEEACRDEYSVCFQGIGKPPVFLYISYYASGFLHEKPLAIIRQHLAQLGLSRKEGVSETEDHISSLCEVMRYLIMVEDLSIGDMNTQKRFFQAHLASWFEPLCDALSACEHASFYVRVGELLRAFLLVERLSFDYEE
jgi:TorA maturation chaperone TorD